MINEIWDLKPCSHQ